jgi:hypothetical protein
MRRTRLSFFLSVLLAGCGGQDVPVESKRTPGPVAQETARAPSNPASGAVSNRAASPPSLIEASSRP